MTLYFLNDVANVLNRHQIKNYVIIASLESEIMNRIPGSPLLIPSLPGSALRMHVELTSLAISTCVLKALPGKLDIKRHPSSILYMSLALASYWIQLS